jgi:hypothetical protein
MRSVSPLPVTTSVGSMLRTPSSALARCALPLSMSTDL